MAGIFPDRLSGNGQVFSEILVFQGLEVEYGLVIAYHVAAGHGG